MPNARSRKAFHNHLALPSTLSAKNPFVVDEKKKAKVSQGYQREADNGCGNGEPKSRIAPNEGSEHSDSRYECAHEKGRALVGFSQNLTDRMTIDSHKNDNGGQGHAHNTNPKDPVRIEPASKQTLQ